MTNHRGTDHPQVQMNGCQPNHKKNKKRKSNGTKKAHKKLNIKRYLFILLTVCLSLGLILYPYIANFVYERQKDGIVDTVETKMKDDDKEKYRDTVKNAKKYNQKLVTGLVQLKDPFDEKAVEEDKANYDAQLNMTKDGVMGIVKIPCINVSLPIYHGTSSDTLEKGVGHLQGTSLPIGGRSTHAVLTGHSGLSKAKLFTDLTSLKEGDLFFIHTAGRKLAYKVDQISVVLPEEMSKLTIEKGKDYCTLVTCTPYGVNTHRLLVRGERIPYTEKKETESKQEASNTHSQWMEEYTKSIVIAAGIFISLLILLIICRYISSHKKKRKKRKRKKSPG